jgi:drug/metabolite transporter (DMT)-like permease
MLALGALGTGVAYVLTVMAAGRVGATRASATAFLIPPVALLLGVLVRGEHVAALSVLGGVVCLAGAWLMRRAQLEGMPNRSSSGSEKPGTTSSPSSTPSVASTLGGRSG